MGIIDSATTSITDAVSGAVDGAVEGLTSAATGFLSALKSLGVKLPLKNVLSNYASYNYIIGLSALTAKDLNFPDLSYKIGKTLPLICKSAGINPRNRVSTAFGKYDFFIDNVNMDGMIGFVNGKGSNVTTVSFDVFEPYSLGVFLLSLQQAAYNAGHANWRDCPFLLTIEFMGENELGSMAPIPATRHIPIKLTTINVKADQGGTKYNVAGYATQGQAGTTQFAKFRADVSIRGKTIQEVLQTGEQSLQAVVNKKLKELEKDKVVAKADEIVIIFPTADQIASSSAGSIVNQISETASAATATITGGGTAGSLYTKLGLVTNQINAEQVQPQGQCNDLGKASMGYNLSDKKADTPMGKEAAAWDAKAGTWTLGKVVVNPSEGTLKFSQDTDIPTAINAVMLTSAYPEKALDPVNQDANGFKPWWRIDTQVYMVDTKANDDTTGTKPRLIVYRVIPYKTHSSKITKTNTKAKGFDNIKKNIIKQYDYLYTGKNTEVIKFDIDFSVSFSNVLAADNYKNNQDVQTAKQNGVQEENTPPTNAAGKGDKPSTVPGTTTSQQNYAGTRSESDGPGGGGKETPKTRAAKLWHSAITSGQDMQTLTLDIVGDPYWIHHSGLGNYTSPQSGLKDLNKDGTVDWQNGEVNILVNFRSPLDINQDTGLYDFNSGGYGAMLATGDPKAPTTGWSGLYCINLVTSTFKGGHFHQTLRGYRLPLQDLKGTGKADSAVGNPIPAESPASTPGYNPYDQAGY
jgi:hypothetical protein